MDGNQLTDNPLSLAMDNNLKTGLSEDYVRGEYHIFNGSDGDFSYIDWGGSGPLIHLAHATGFCAQTYAPIAERLCGRFRVVGMDDRGHGRTEADANPRKLKDWYLFAKDLERFVEHFGEPVIAMGHSRGAVASLLLAAKRPEMIRALVLIDPTILPFSWMWWWFLAKKTGLSRFVPIAARAARRNPFWPDRDTLLKAYRVKQPFAKWKEGFLEGYIAGGTVRTNSGGIRLSCTPAWESRCFSVCSHDVWRYITQIQPPTLLIYGSESDIFLPRAVKRFQAKAPHAVIRRFQGTSHFVPMERPDETVDSLLMFLQEKDLLGKDGSDR